MRVTGDATLVQFKSGSRRYGAGELPPGTYSIEARFPDQEPIPAGTIEVGSGQTLTVHCSAGFRRCDLR